MATHTSPHVPPALEICLLTERLYALLTSPTAFTHTTLVLTADEPNMLPLDIESAPDFFDTRHAHICAHASEAARAAEECREPEPLVGLSISFTSVDHVYPVYVLINGIYRRTSRDPQVFGHWPCVVLQPKGEHATISAAAIALTHISPSLTEHGRRRLSADLDESIRRSHDIGVALAKTAAVAEAMCDPHFRRHTPAFSTPA